MDFYHKFIRKLKYDNEMQTSIIHGREYMRLYFITKYIDKSFYIELLQELIARMDQRNTEYFYFDWIGALDESEAYKALQKELGW